MAAGDIIYASDFKLGVVGFGRRTTSSGATITAETGYLRLDGIRLYAGRTYRVHTTPLNLKGSVVGDHPEARMRVNNAGTATTASTLIGSVRGYVGNAAVADARVLSVNYVPSGDTTTASFLLSLARVASGAGSTGVQMFASATTVVEIAVVDEGPVQPDSGTSL